MRRWADGLYISPVHAMQELGKGWNVDSAAIKQKRMFIRQSTISGPLPGRLVENGTERKIEAWPLDVSPRGLGVLIKVPLIPGARLSFFTETKTITLEVVNCQPHLGIDNLYRVGLFVRDQDENLHETFQKLGLLTELSDVEVFSRFI